MRSSRHPSRPSAVLATLIMVLVARSARAEEAESPRPRQGYYLSLGPTGGLSLSRERRQLGSALGGGGGMLRLGELLTPKLGVGISIDGGVGVGDDRNTTAYLGFDVHYLVLELVAVHAGVGFGLSRLQDPGDADAESRGGIGATYVLGLSHDWFLTDQSRSGGFSLTPLVQLRLTDADKVETGQLFVGVQVTWWTGLDKARLTLEETQAYGQR